MLRWERVWWCHKERALRSVWRIGKLPDDTWAEPDEGIPITQTQWTERHGTKSSRYRQGAISRAQKSCMAGIRSLAKELGLYVVGSSHWGFFLMRKSHGQNYPSEQSLWPQCGGCQLRDQSGSCCDGVISISKKGSELEAVRRKRRQPVYFRRRKLIRLGEGREEKEA